MLRKKSIISLILVMVLSLSLASPALAAANDPGNGPPDSSESVPVDTSDSDPVNDPASDPVDDPFGQLTPSGLTLGTSGHTAYISGSNGYFRPQNDLTRAETAEILYRLLPQEVTAFVSYSDVLPGAWYYQSAGVMGALGVLRANESMFLPDEAITRGEFIRAVACFFPVCDTAAQFPDVSPLDPDAAYYQTARSWGWISGFEDGTLQPQRTITRAEAVTILNRALGRSADSSYSLPLVYLDVSADSWYYGSVMEASVTHEYFVDTGVERWTSNEAPVLHLTPGFHLIDNWLYYFSAERNNFVCGDSVGNFDFDAAGHFTTGSADLDARLHEIVRTKTNDSMTQEQKLRALYVYTRDSFTYLRRPAYEFGATGFMQTDALNILTTGYGNCYSYASLFWYLSRWLGYDSKIYSGTVGSNRAPHCWVEINFYGKDYIFDTELEMAYHKKGRYEINLYKYIDVDGWRYVRP